jgi:acyl-CoA reductase-like NAD-dependent aldehyde dehydrogenase
MTEAATPINTSPDFSSMFADLKATFETERTMNLAWRAEQLTALEHMMEECEQEFMDALKSDLGKHHQEAWTTEISFVASDASYSRGFEHRCWGSRGKAGCSLSLWASS